MLLKGKIAVVTGGSLGFGFCITKKLLEKGCTVYIIGRNKLHIKSALSKFSSVNVKGIVGDVSDYKNIKKIIKAINPIDILINNAGIYFEGQIDVQSSKKISQIIDVNLKGVIYTTKAVMTQMLIRNKGHIVNIASMSALKGKELEAVYSASKFGVRGFTESLKLDLKDTNIKLIGFYPGSMNTNLIEDSSVLSKNSSWMDPEKVAEIIIFVLEQDDSMNLNVEVTRAKLT
ncbi:MAG: SDR family oxidoreductase [Candidatus Levybacteria bacterium]|nr:SDR family oxidoreductase [Candidatus Levybacteria bacterium]